MAKDLKPYDPSEQSRSSRSDDARDGDKHFHYYDQRTFVQEDGQAEELEEEAYDPVLHGWQKLALAAITVTVFAAAIAHFAPAETTVTMNIVETNTIDPEPVATTPAAPQTTREMLTSGLPTACGQTDVRETVIGEIRPSDVDGQKAALAYAINTISLASVDSSVSSVTCEANVTISARGHNDKSFPIRYTIRPSVNDDSSAVVGTSAPGATEYAKQIAQEAIFAASVDDVRNSWTAAPAASDSPAPGATPTASGE